MAPSSSTYAPEEQALYDVFISHCKKADGTEDRALWLVDTFEEAGMKPFFDLQNLEEISPEQLTKDVKSSKALVTIIDPETFKSQWVILENQTASDNGIPIIPFYDGDRWKWNDISFWVAEYPAFFKIPAIEYHRTFHKHCKALLISKAKGERRYSEQLVAPNEVVATAAEKLAKLMRDLLEKKILPPSCAKLCRASDSLKGEAGSLSADLVEEPSVESLLADLRTCVEDTEELVHTVEGLAPPKQGGGGCFGGGNKTSIVAIHPLPVATIDGLLGKDVEIATMRGALRAALGDARRTMRLKRASSASSIADFWRQSDASSSGKSWDELMGLITSELSAMGAQDEEVATAAKKAASLLPKLKAKLVDDAGNLKMTALRQAFGDDGGNVTGTLLDAAQGVEKPERVFFPEFKVVDGASGTSSDAGLGDAGFVMVRENATLAALRLLLRTALGNTELGPQAAAGAYTFYLHDGKTKVDTRDEESFLVFDHTPGLILVPTTGKGYVPDNAPSSVTVDALFGEAQAAEDAESKDAYAAGLSLEKVLTDPQLVLRFKRVTYADGLGEENASFLSELREIREAVEGLTTGKEYAWALALPRLRTLATVYLAKASSMKLEAKEETKSAAVAQFASAAKAGSASLTGETSTLFAAFAQVEEEVAAACEARLPLLRKAVSEAGPLRNVGKARRTVVVVGGGIAGSLIGRWLDKHHSETLHTVLVDPKEYHELTLMMLRAVVNDSDDFQRRVRCPHTEYIRNGTFVQESCQEVAPDHIKVGSSGQSPSRTLLPHRTSGVLMPPCLAPSCRRTREGRRSAPGPALDSTHLAQHPNSFNSTSVSAGSESSIIPFDYLILATGCHYAEGIKTASPSMEYRIKQYAAERRKVATAQRVLIIGSGVVGNELCGEIVDAFPSKEIIMIGRSTLLRRAGPEAHRMISEHWASKGVKCIFNEEMLPLKPGDTHYMTVKGTKVPVDGTRAFWCTGRDTPNSTMLKKNFPTSLDNYGYTTISNSDRLAVPHPHRQRSQAAHTGCLQHPPPHHPLTTPGTSRLTSQRVSTACRAATFLRSATALLAQRTPAAIAARSDSTSTRSSHVRTSPRWRSSSRCANAGYTPPLPRPPPRPQPLSLHGTPTIYLSGCCCLPPPRPERRRSYAAVPRSSPSRSTLRATMAARRPR